MGRQIIKQPNGLFAVWSSIVDNFIMLNAQPQEIINYYVKEETERITNFVTKDIEMLNEGKEPFRQFTKTWDEALDFIKLQHGIEEVINIQNQIIQTT